MKTIFLGFGFRPEDRDLVNAIETLVASHSLLTVTGEVLGGQGLTPGVQKRIKQSDGLIGLLTRRDQLATGGWTTHQWVLDEIAYARNSGRPAIGIVEQGVEFGGMYQANERIELDRANAMPAILKLSESIGQWKREAGRTIQVQLLPPLAARKIASPESPLKCRYRLFHQGAASEWKEATPFPGPGGTFILCEGVQDEHSIQITVKDHEVSVWYSDECSQWMQIKLNKNTRGR